MDFISLFAGMGGFDLGLERSGMRCVAQVERDKHCLNVLARHWPEVERFNDVCAFGAAVTVHRPAILCGGFPCQDISVAGKRAGLAGERSGLFWEFVRCIEEFAPRWVLLENVAGLLSSNRGRDMGAVVGALEKRGYWWAYRVLDSQHFGVPQRRRRVFIVGHLGDRTYPARVLFESEGLPWDSPPSRKAKQDVAGTIDAGSGVRRGAGINTGMLTPGPWWDGSDTAPCLDVSMLAKQQMMPEKGRFAAVIAHTLRAEGHDASEDGTGRGVPLVPMVANPIKSGGNLRHDESHETYSPVAFDETQITSGENRSNPQPGDPCHPLVAAGRPPSIAYQCHGSNVGPMGTLRAGNGNETGGVPFIFQTRCARNGRGMPSDVAPALTSCEGGTHADTKPHVVAGTAVRRLTPRECERLQGFPDDWTAVGADGKPISNSQRYKMCGNAVSVPVIEWIGRRIMEVSGGA